MLNKRWFLPAAIGAVAVMLSGALASLSLGPIFVFVAAIAFIYSSWTVIQDRSGRYDLKKLAQVDERETLRQLEDELETGQDYDSALCTGCGEIYPIEFSTCPRCARKRSC